MFPLGRYIAFGKDDFGKKELNCGEVKYLLQPIECGDKSETHTVREWFGDFDVSLEDTAFVHWNQAMSVISMKLKELEMQLDMMVMMSLWLTVRIALYENSRIRIAPVGHSFMQCVQPIQRSLSIFKA